MTELSLICKFLGIFLTYVSGSTICVILVGFAVKVGLLSFETYCAALRRSVDELMPVLALWLKYRMEAKYSRGKDRESSE